jgi:hypothetical protein
MISRRVGRTSGRSLTDNGQSVKSCFPAPALRPVPARSRPCENNGRLIADLQESWEPGRELCASDPKHIVVCCEESRANRNDQGLVATQAGRRDNDEIISPRLVPAGQAPRETLSAQWEADAPIWEHEVYASDRRSTTPSSPSPPSGAITLRSTPNGECASAAPTAGPPRRTSSPRAPRPCRREPCRRS